MKAFVLCGGEGTRLRPYTYSIPKPMLPLGKRPILEFVVSNLHSHGITDITLAVGYLSERIKDYFGNGENFGVNISYLTEKEKMNTAGCLYPARNEVKETFLVLMGDHLTTINLRNLIDFHRKKKGVATIGLKKTGTPLEFGVARLDEESRITGFEEKPIISNYVNAGIYCLEPEVFNYIKVGHDFAKNVFPGLIADKKKVFGYSFDEYWMDIGRLHDYESLNNTISIIDLVEHCKTCKRV